MELKIKTNPSYNIILEKGLVSGGFVADALNDLDFEKVAIVTDEKVGGLYLSLVKNSLEKQDKEVYCYTIKEGEQSKCLQTVADIYTFLCEKNFSRSDLIIALGGGVVGDTAGFVAATFLRGIPIIQIPTTLLAMIDSSIGGKTGVNLDSGKNLVGSFYQPARVLVDIEVLKTLDENEWQNGIGEMIKYGAIKDSLLFNHLMKGDLKNDIDKLILRCLKIKKYVVEKDTLDKGLRQILNFGHTLGHGIEKHSNYQISHGKAVGIGMALITKWAEKRSLAKNGVALKIERALQKYNMPFEYQLDIDKLWSYAL
ncbi:MAG: 3-dehydroquinate synthase, partial [Bacillota bacterium]